MPTERDLLGRSARLREARIVTAERALFNFDLCIAFNHRTAARDAGFIRGIDAEHVPRRTAAGRIDRAHRVATCRIGTRSSRMHGKARTACGTACSWRSWTEKTRVLRAVHIPSRRAAIWISRAHVVATCGVAARGIAVARVARSTDGRAAIAHAHLIRRRHAERIPSATTASRIHGAHRHAARGTVAAAWTVHGDA